VFKLTQLTTIINVDETSALDVFQFNTEEQKIKKNKKIKKKIKKKKKLKSIFF